MRVCKALVCGRGSLARRSGRDGYVTGEFSFLFVIDRHKTNRSDKPKVHFFPILVLSPGVPGLEV